MVHGRWVRSKWPLIIYPYLGFFNGYVCMYAFIYLKMKKKIHTKTILTIFTKAKPNGIKHKSHVKMQKSGCLIHLWVQIYPKITIKPLINEHMEFNCLITHTHNATIKEICEAFAYYTSTLCLGLTTRLNDFVDPTFQQILYIKANMVVSVYVDKNWAVPGRFFQSLFVPCGVGDKQGRAGRPGQPLRGSREVPFLLKKSLGENQGTYI